MFLIIILNLLFASAYVIGKSILEISSPIAFVGLRMTFAGLILLTYYFAKSKLFSNQKNKINFIQNFWLFLKLAIIHIYIPFVFEFLGMQCVSAAKTSLLYNLSPFLTAIFAYFLFKEKLNLPKFIGLIIGFLGFIPIIAHHVRCSDLPGEFLKISLPDILILIAVASSAYAWIIIKKHIKEIPLILINGISMFMGGILAIITSLFIENWNPIPITNIYNFIYLTFLIIIVSNFIGYNLYGYLLKRYSSTFLSFNCFTIPLFTALMEWFFLDGKIGWDFITSFILVTIGLYIFYQEEISQNHFV